MIKPSFQKVKMTSTNVLAGLIVLHCFAGCSNEAVKGEAADDIASSGETFKLTAENIVQEDTRSLRDRLIERGIDPDIRPGRTAGSRAVLARTDVNDHQRLSEAQAIDACDCKTRSCVVSVMYAYRTELHRLASGEVQDTAIAAARKRALACHDALPIQ